MLQEQLVSAIEAGDYSEDAKEELANRVSAQRIPEPVYNTVANAAYAEQLAKGPSDKSRKIITQVMYSRSLRGGSVDGWI
jgi:DNA-directed RNA polymerase subunit F